MSSPHSLTFSTPGDLPRCRGCGKEVDRETWAQGEQCPTPLLTIAQVDYLHWYVDALERGMKVMG